MKGLLMHVMLFDLDNTLLAGDSDFEWAQFLIEKGVLDREVYEARNQEFYDHYKAGTLDIHAFLDFQLKPLSRHPRKQLDDWHAEFMREKIRPLILPKARELVDRALAEADLTAIVTATNRFVTAPIAREFGVEHLLATEPEEVEGEFTGRASGVPCFREGKIARVEEWLANMGIEWREIEHSVFYSDSLNDLPLLETVGTPVAVDPDPTLLAHAQKHGWSVISLR
jgi:HAD superfamily hydrolase (TIGR01490 family)